MSPLGISIDNLGMPRFSQAATMVRAAGCATLFETTHSSTTFMRRHRHDSAYISITLDGSYTELRDGIPECRPRGAVVFHPAGEEHSDYFERNVRCLNVALRHPETLVQESPPTPSADALLSHDVAEIVRWFYSSVSRSEMLDAPMRNFLGRLSPRRPTRDDTGPPAWLHAALARFNWIDPVPFERAASLAGVHPTHFSRAFRYHLRMTPNTYRRRARVRLASQLLLSSTNGLSAIAQRCGFFDQSHFTHVFGEVTGVTPAEYRRIFAA